MIFEERRSLVLTPIGNDDQIHLCLQMGFSTTRTRQLTAPCGGLNRKSETTCKASTAFNYRSCDSSPAFKYPYLHESNHAVRGAVSDSHLKLEDKS